MKYWRINTDHEEKDDRFCDLWYKYAMAFAGDFEGYKGEHAGAFCKFSPGDGVFMHQSNYGVVGYGIVKEEWDEETYEGAERRLYVLASYEYRIAMDWDVAYDCRENPLPIYGRLPYGPRYYSEVKSEKWDIESVLEDLRKQASAKPLQVARPTSSSLLRF